MAGAESGGAARFSCPPNFAATPPASEPHFSLEVLTGPDTELWLIRAPADFDPNSLNGRLVPLSGSQIVKGKLAGKRHRYRVLSSSDTPAGEATLLAPSAEAGGRLTCAPAARGSLRIFEGSQETLPGTPLQPIPASPPPQIPLGLRPRFCAFGGSPPVTGPGSPLALKTMTSEKREKKKQVSETSVPQEAMNGHKILEVETTLGSPDMSVGKKKKKKKKQQLQEVEETEPAVTEPAAEMLEPLGVLFLSKKRKKPKKAETVEPEMGMLEPEEKTVLGLMIKTEPLEETVLSTTKKRKRQKRGIEGIEPVEPMIAESQLQVKVEPQDEAILLPSVKKRKKERGHEVIMEPEKRPVALHVEVTEPEQPDEVEPQAQAALASTKMSRKKEKCQKAVMEPGIKDVRPQEVMEPELPDDTEPQAAPASTKKRRKKERGHKAMEPGTEMIFPREEMTEPELPDEGKLEAKAVPASTKKRKKQDQESKGPEMVPQEEMLEPLLYLELADMATAGRKKKRKKLQLDPV